MPPIMSPSTPKRNATSTRRGNAAGGRIRATMKFWSVIAASLLSIGVVAACGDDETSAYCNDLKKFQALTESIQDADQQEAAEAMDKAASKIKDDGKSAPDEIKEDWDSLSVMLSGDLDLNGEGDGKQ